jgi:uncharacterized tellurite resistance protein B-like protein
VPVTQQDASDEGPRRTGQSGTDATGAASIRRVASELASLSPERRSFLAGYAYILVRVARADSEADPAETRRIEAAVTAAGDVSEAQAALLVALAGRTSSLYGPSEDYAVTREFARRSSPQERQRLMRACISVLVTSGPISGSETAELYEVGRELGFSAEEVNAIRQQVEPADRNVADPAT